VSRSSFTYVVRAFQALLEDDLVLPQHLFDQGGKLSVAFRDVADCHLSRSYQTGASRYTRPRNLPNCRRSRFDGFPSCANSNCGAAFRSSMAFCRASRLSSVS